LLNRPEIEDVREICRLCGGETAFAFRKVLLGKFDVGFFRCSQCKSLQSEEPYWLAEAYASAVDAMDTGAAQRVLHCFALTHSVLRVLGCRTALDFGGGFGLLCRLLRDAGHDAYWYDQYSSPGYATGFVGSPRDAYDLITSFEVIEHFPNPRDDLDAIFVGERKAVLLMTELYAGQGEDWWYLAPEEGQHIFFYSPEALRFVGERYGYQLLLCHEFILFLRGPATKFQRWVLQSFLRHRIIRWIKLRLLAGSGRGVQADYDTLVARVRETPNEQTGDLLK
jgi:hypothetical protein